MPYPASKALPASWPHLLCLPLTAATRASCQHQRGSGSSMGTLHWLVPLLRMCLCHTPVCFSLLTRSCLSYLLLCENSAQHPSQNGSPIFPVPPHHLTLMYFFRALCYLTSCVPLLIYLSASLPLKESSIWAGSFVPCYIPIAKRPPGT